MRSVVELIGPLNLFWRTEFEDDLATLDDYELPTDDLRVYANSTIKSITTLCPKYMAKYGSAMPCLFNPRRYARMAHKDILYGETASNVVRPILARLQLKFTMATK
ncbi:hypothetical protein PV11_04479 [Exophiala sideris]|uniref:Uncharacterized protein n=1 Tax=Exophiala sideris TaxID=1016849 RepID=A0A0D1W0U8_9EURO|nr:hypothetical protein PV11_04479 [Exophiala sideris]